MKHKMQIINPYKLKNMIVVVEQDRSKSLWYLYDMSGKLVKKGYGTRVIGIPSRIQALNNAKQVARRFIRKNNPLIFGL